MWGTLLFLDFGAGELFIIALAVLLLFGSKKIPELARGFGKGVRELKDATNNIQREINSSMAEPAREVKPQENIQPKEDEDKPLETPSGNKPQVVEPPAGAMPRSNTGYSAGLTPDRNHGVEPGSHPGGDDAGNKPDGNGNDQTH